MAVENGKVLLLGKVWCWRSLYLKPLSDSEKQIPCVLVVLLCPERQQSWS